MWLPGDGPTAQQLTAPENHCPVHGRTTTETQQQRWLWPSQVPTGATQRAAGEVADGATAAPRAPEEAPRQREAGTAAMAGG